MNRMSDTPLVGDSTAVVVPSPPQQFVAKAPSIPASTQTNSVQTAEKFLSREFPPKEPLIDGLLFQRDIVAFAGRRRHGKTTFLSDLATSLTIPHKDFL